MLEAGHDYVSIFFDGMAVLSANDESVDDGTASDVLVITGHDDGDVLSGRGGGVPLHVFFTKLDAT